MGCSHSRTSRESHQDRKCSACKYINCRMAGQERFSRCRSGPKGKFMGQLADAGRRIAFVTIGENRVFPLLTELFQSVKDAGFTQGVTFCVLDHGLTSIQSEALSAQRVRIHAPTLEISLKPGQRTQNPLELSAISKAFIPSYFPDFDTYVFCDCRAWVQDREGLELFVRATHRNNLAVTSSSSRFSNRVQPLEWIGAGVVRLRSQLYRSAVESRLPREARRQLSNRPALNTDLFALSGGAPHWESIQNWTREALKKGPVQNVDQLAFSTATFLDGLSAQILPEWCNYSGPWRIDAPQGRLVEYHLPFHLISIVNFRRHVGMTVDQALSIPMLDTDDHVHHKSLRYPHWSSHRFVGGEIIAPPATADVRQSSKIVS